MKGESASVYLHYLESGPAEALRALLGLEEAIATQEEQEGTGADINLTRTDLQTIVEALDFMSAAMDDADFPHGHVDDLAEKLESLLGMEA